jgi:hypothetical protein
LELENTSVATMPTVKRVTNTWQVVNGTYVPVYLFHSEPDDVRSGLSGNYVQALFLGVLFVVGFVSCVLLIGKSAK